MATLYEGTGLNDTFSADPCTIRVIYETKLGETWAEREQLLAMTDQEIIELVQDDPGYFLDGGTWKVVRP